MFTKLVHCDLFKFKCKIDMSCTFITISKTNLYNCIILGLINHAAKATVTTPNGGGSSDSSKSGDTADSSKSDDSKSRRSAKISDTLEEVVDEKQRYCKQQYEIAFRYKT